MDSRDLARTNRRDYPLRGLRVRLFRTCSILCNDRHTGVADKQHYFATHLRTKPSMCQHSDPIGQLCGKAKTRGTWWPYIRPCKYTEHPSSIAGDDNVDKHGVKGTRAGSNSPSELQDIASKLSALAQQIKTIAAVPLSDAVDLDECGEASRRAAIE